MKKTEKISKLIDFMMSTKMKEFIDIIEYANNNNLLKTLNKHKELFIEAFKDKKENGEYIYNKETLFKQWEEEEDKIHAWYEKTHKN